MQSSRVRLMLVTLFGVLALGALTAAAAQAVEAPRWSILGADLAEGKTHFISAKAYSSRLQSQNCGCCHYMHDIQTEGRVAVRLERGNAGIGNGAFEFETCTVSGIAGGKTIEKCKVQFVDGPIKVELVESGGAEPAIKKGSLLVLFVPVSGTSYTTLKFTTETGGNCPFETKVTGKVAGQVFTDPNTPPTLGTLVTLEGGATEAGSWLVNFPTTQPNKVTKIKAGISSEQSQSGPGRLFGTSYRGGDSVNIIV